MGPSHSNEPFDSDRLSDTTLLQTRGNIALNWLPSPPFFFPQGERLGAINAGDVEDSFSLWKGINFNLLKLIKGMNVYGRQ